MASSSIDHAKKRIKKNPAEQLIVGAPLEGFRAGLDGPVAANPATACLELRSTSPGIGGLGGRIAPPASGSNVPTVIDIQVVVDLNTYPFVVQEGSIRGNIYSAPGTGWKVTWGYFGTPNSRF